MMQNFVAGIVITTLFILVFGRREERGSRTQSENQAGTYQNQASPYRNQASTYQNQASTYQTQTHYDLNRSQGGEFRPALNWNDIDFI